MGSHHTCRLNLCGWCGGAAPLSGQASWVNPCVETLCAAELAGALSGAHASVSAKGGQVHFIDWFDLVVGLEMNGLDDRFLLLSGLVP